MGPWYISLAGQHSDLKAAECCLDFPEATVFRHDGDYCLRSTEFDTTNSFDEVAVRSIPLLRTVNGAIRVVADNYRPIHAWSAHREGRIGYGICSASRDAWFRQRDDDARSSSDLWERGSAKAPEVPYLFAAARARPEVARAFDLWQAPRSGDSVYKIYEILRDDLGDRLYSLASRADVNRFTGSVNRPDVLGEYARHEVQPGLPPRNPMSVAEVESFIQSLLQRWAGTIGRSVRR